MDLTIAGLNPAGMIDWPGRLAAVVFLAGCNYRCPFCHNPELVAGVEDPDQFSLEQLLTSLAAKKNWIEGVVLTGGEPTFSPGLVRLCRALKSAGFPVKLDTNGSRPEVVSALAAENLIDYVAVDLKAPGERYPAATGGADATPVWRTISALGELGLDSEIRITVVPGLLSMEALSAMSESIAAAGVSTLFLQQFRPDRTLDPAFGLRRPWPAERLLAAAEQCSQYLPTIVRGIGNQSTSKTA